MIHILMWQLRSFEVHFTIIYHFEFIDQELFHIGGSNICSLCFSWTELPPLQTARVFLDVEWISDGHVFAVGGWDNNKQPTATVEMLECSWDTEESANGGWQYVAPMNHSRHGHAVAFIHGKILAVGGSGIESVECFTLPNADFPLGQWVLLRPMSSPARLIGLQPFGDDLLVVGKRRLRALSMFN